MLNRKSIILVVLLLSIYQPCAAAEVNSKISENYIHVTLANLRQTPEPTSTIIDKLSIATAVVILQRNGEWAKVVVKDGSKKGTEGWIATELLSDQKPSADQLIKQYDACRQHSLLECHVLAERAIALAPSNEGVLRRYSESKSVIQKNFFDSPRRSLRSELCGLLPEGNICVKPKESALHDEPQESVTKMRSGITVKLKNGKVRNFKNEGMSNPWGPDLEYEVLGFLRENEYFLLKSVGHLGESVAYYFVSYATGKTTTLQSSGYPFFSPEGNSFARIPIEHGANGPETMDIYSIGKESIDRIDSVKLESCSSSDSTCGWPYVLWVDTSHIVVFSSARDGARNYSIGKIIFRFKKSEDRWKLHKN
jgi:hypothetical protein